jgi:hypothetical protein
VRNISDRFEGEGSLQPHDGGEAMPVKFAFAIVRTMVTRPGLPPAQAGATGRGIVLAADGTYLVEGFYRLALPDGRRIKVQKLGFEWHILASLGG